MILLMIYAIVLGVIIFMICKRENDNYINNLTLYNACDFGCTAKFKELLDAGANIDSVYNIPHYSGGMDRITLLKLACLQGYSDIVSLLISRGADIDGCIKPKKYKRSSPLGKKEPKTRSSPSGKEKQNVKPKHNVKPKYNVKPKHKLKQVNLKDQPPIWYACSKGNTDVVKFLIDNNADASDPVLLQMTCARGYFEIAIMLIHNGAKPTEGYFYEYNIHENMCNCCYYEDISDMLHWEDVNDRLLYDARNNIPSKYMRNDINNT
jgi:ankyrin repeat protein